MMVLLRRVQMLLRSVETLLGGLLGIVLGIVLALPYYIGLFVLMWWYLIPLNFTRLSSGENVFMHPQGIGSSASPGWVAWVLWGIVLYYAVFLFCFVWSACRATRRTGLMADGVISATWMAVVMVVSAIIPAAFTMMWEAKASLSLVWLYLGPSAMFCAIFFVPLLVMSVIAGLIGAGWGMASFKKKERVAAL